MFNNRVEELIKFNRENGGNEPTLSGKGLCRWYKDQQTHYQKGTLAQDWINRLKTLDSVLINILPHICWPTYVTLNMRSWRHSILSMDATVWVKCFTNISWTGLLSREENTKIQNHLMANSNYWRKQQFYLMSPTEPGREHPKRVLEVSLPPLIIS